MTRRLIAHNARMVASTAVVDTIPSLNLVTTVVQVVCTLVTITAGLITALPLPVDTVGATTVGTTTTPLAVPLVMAQVVPAAMVSF